MDGIKIEIPVHQHSMRALVYPQDNIHIENIQKFTLIGKRYDNVIITSL